MEATSFFSNGSFLTSFSIILFFILCLNFCSTQELQNNVAQYISRCTDLIQKLSKKSFQHVTIKYAVYYSTIKVKVKVKIVQSCPTLSDPMDYRVHGILQARILKRVAFPFSSGSFQHRNPTRVSCIAGRFFTN